MLVSKPAIVSAELGTRHIAYVEGSDGIGYGEQLVHIRNLQTGRDRVVYRAQSGGMNLARVTKPSYSAQIDSYTWARTNSG